MFRVVTMTGWLVLSWMARSLSMTASSSVCDTYSRLLASLENVTEAPQKKAKEEKENNNKQVRQAI